MHVDAMPLVWLALPIYLAIGVTLWCRWPFLRDFAGEAGYVGGMIITAFIWPFLLAMLAVIGIFFSVGWLLYNLFRLFRHKR
jgi:hypothetical protein